MKPYYEQDGITIYHGDCREVLPTLEPVDLVLTDPPYGIGEAAGKNASRGLLAISRDYGVASWDNKTVDFIGAVIAAGRSSVIFGGNFYDLPPSPCWLVWDKDNGKTDFADVEMAWTNLKGAARIKRHRWQGMLQEYSGRDKESRHHPTQKPLPVMRWCIERAGNVETILDPFMGSGTTLVAAKELNRQAIGIEIEERYCEIAANRLAQGVFNFAEVANG